MHLLDEESKLVEIEAANGDIFSTQETAFYCVFSSFENAIDQGMKRETAEFCVCVKQADSVKEHAVVTHKTIDGDETADAFDGLAEKLIVAFHITVDDRIFNMKDRYIVLL